MWLKHKNCILETGPFNSVMNSSRNCDAISFSEYCFLLHRKPMHRILVQVKKMNVQPVHGRT